MSLSTKVFRLLPDTLQKQLKAKLHYRAIGNRVQRADQKLSELALQLSSDPFKQIQKRQEWVEKKTAIKEQLIHMLGLAHLSDVTLHQATSTGTIDQEKYTIEKWLFEYKNGIYTTTNLYIPKNGKSSLPCVVYLCGHLPSLDGAKTGFQDRYLWYPENGFVLMVVDPFGFGEIPGIHHGTCRLNKWDWLSKGYTPAGAEVWNAMQLINWLAKRPEADISRLAVTGISGGGVMTQYLSAIDERVKVVAASCSTYTIGHQVTNSLINGQCDCTYYPNIYQIDFPEVLALIAPRPFLILGGKKDDIFPPGGFRAAYQQVKKVYDLYDDSTQARIKLVESNDGHTDPPHFLEETRKWICTWLNHEIPAGSNHQYVNTQKEAPQNIRVTHTNPANVSNAIIDQSWGKGTVKPDHFSQQRKDKVLKVISEQVFQWFPQKRESLRARSSAGSGGILSEWTNHSAYVITTEEDVEVLAQLSLPREINTKISLLVWVKNTEDHVYFPDVDEFFPFLRTHALLIINPRFSETYLPPKIFTRIERSSAILGRSIASQQVWDVLQVLAWIKQQHLDTFNNIHLFGKGNMAIVSLYATLFDPSISHLVMTAPPDTHLKGPAIPGILRYADIPELTACIAPRQVSIINDCHHLLSRAQPYFAAISQADKINQYPSTAQLHIR